MIPFYIQFLISSENSETFINGSLLWFRPRRVFHYIFLVSDTEAGRLTYFLCTQDPFPQTSTVRSLNSRTIHSRSSYTTLSIMTRPKLLYNLNLTLWVLTLTPGSAFNFHVSHCLVLYLHHSPLWEYLSSPSTPFHIHNFPQSVVPITLLPKSLLILETRRNLILNCCLEGAPFSSRLICVNFTPTGCNALGRQYNSMRIYAVFEVWKIRD